MGSQNKIIQYQLEELTIKLCAKGKTQPEVAQLLSEELKSRSIDDIVSQPTVSRYMKQHRETVAEQAQSIIREYVQGTTPADIDRIEDAIKLIHDIVKDQVRVKTAHDEIVQPASYDIKFREKAAVDLIKVVLDKLNNTGVLPKETQDGKPDIEESVVPARSNVRSIIDRFGIGASGHKAGSSQTPVS